MKQEDDIYDDELLDEDGLTEEEENELEYEQMRHDEMSEYYGPFYNEYQDAILFGCYCRSDVNEGDVDSVYNAISELNDLLDDTETDEDDRPLIREEIERLEDVYYYLMEEDCEYDTENAYSLCDIGNQEEKLDTQVILSIEHQDSPIEHQDSPIEHQKPSLYFIRIFLPFLELFAIFGALYLIYTILFK